MAGVRERIGDWTVVLIRQVDWPPFLPWCALATRKIDGKVYGLNAEGTNRYDALRRVRLILQGRGSD